MANVPELEEPTAQPESAPAPLVPVPQQGAFGGAEIGHALSGAGEELYRVGYEAHHRALEAQSQGQEADFQNKAFDLLSQYRRLENGDAVNALPHYEQQLKTLYAQSANTLTSKQARLLFNSNALRNLRIVHELMGGWFDVQERNYRRVQYKTLQDSDTFAVAKIAQADSYDAGAVESKIDGIYKRAFDRARGEGLDEKTAQAFAEGDAQPAVEGLFKMLTDPNSGRSTDLIKSEVLRYQKKGLVGPMQAHTLQDSMGARDVYSEVSKIVNDPSLRISYAQDLPADRLHGPIDENAVNDLIERKIQEDPANIDRADEYRKYAHDFVSRTNKMVEDGALQLMDRISANGGTLNPQNIGLVNMLRRNSQKVYHKLLAQEATDSLAKIRLATTREKFTSHQTALIQAQDLLELADQNPQMLKDMKSSQFKGMGMVDSDLRATIRLHDYLVKEMQTPASKFNARQYIKDRLLGEGLSDEDRKEALSEMAIRLPGMADVNEKSVAAMYEDSMQVIHKGFFSDTRKFKKQHEKRLQDEKTPPTNAAERVIRYQDLIKDVK